MVMFALLPAFLELIDDFAGNWDRDGGRNKDGDGNLMKRLLLLCTIASYAILGVATWRVTRFMREDANDRGVFLWGLSFFCIEAVLLSMLVLKYQHHFDDDDNGLVKLTCMIWTVSGLVAAAGSILNIIHGAKHEIENMRLTSRTSSSFNYNKAEKRMQCFLSAVLRVMCYALQFRFLGIACHAYFRYDEPWMAAAAILAYTTLGVVALYVNGSLPAGYTAVCDCGTFILPIITLSLLAPEHSLDRHERASLNKINSWAANLLMCHVSYGYAFGHLFK